MEKKRMLEIAKEEKVRFQLLQDTCKECLPDEMMEWIDSVIELIDKKG